MDKLTDYWIYKASEKHIRIMKRQEIIYECIADPDVYRDADIWNKTYQKYQELMIEDFIKQ